MRFKSRRMTIASVLFIALMVQVVFAGGGNSVKSNADTNILVKDEESIFVGSDVVPDENVDLITEEEVVSAELNVVYKSNLTSTPVVDKFENTTDKGNFYNKIISYTVTRLCIYSEPDLTSPVVGVMYSGSVGDVIERGTEWSKISSGGVVGYIRNVAVIFDDEAEVIAKTLGKENTVVEKESLTVYSEPSTTSSAIAVLSKGQSVDTLDVYGDYIMVNAAEGYGYIEKSGVSITYGLPTAISIEEEQRLKAEEEAEAARKAAEEAKKAAEKAAAEALQAAKDKYQNVPTVNRAPYTATPEEVHLLAAIVYYESGWEPADGQLAVANVVLNRVLSPRFKQNTIADVIYAPGQFTGVVVNGGPSEKFQSILNMSNEQLNARGAYDAAVTALAGVNNIGDLTFFISVKKANYARYSRYTVINNHCFYAFR